MHPGRAVGDSVVVELIRNVVPLVASLKRTNGNPVVANENS